MARRHKVNGTPRPQATAKPYRFIDRRGAGQRGYMGRSNTLVRSATQTTEREQISLLDRDSHNIITSFGRRTLMTLGRWLYANFPAVEAAVNEQAELAAERFSPLYTGQDREWGEMATEWLTDWHEAAVMQGWQFGYHEFLELIIISIIRDGDLGILLTEMSDGYPRLQMIGGHRIDGEDQIVQGGRYDGATLIDGVVMSPFATPRAYRITTKPIQVDEVFISAQDIIVPFFPRWVDQVRGFSLLASSVFDWKDVQERRKFELLAQKIGASISLIEENDEGEPSATDTIIGSDPTYDSTTDEKTALLQETFEGGTVRYFRSRSGNGLKPFTNDRPSASAMDHEDTIIRTAMAGMGWSIDFCLDPTKPGGAQMRVVIDKINRTLRKRCRMLCRVMRRIDSWAIAKAIKRGDLPMNDEWWKWDYQTAPELTADKKYQSEVSIDEYRIGFTSLQRECSRRGMDWKRVQDENIEARKRLEDRCDEEGLNPDIIELKTPNGNVPGESSADYDITDSTDTADGNDMEDTEE